MANWYGTARSNYFKVKDAEAFKSFADSVNLRWHASPDGSFMIHANDEGSWPNDYYDETREDYVELDLVCEISQHLQEDQIVVLIEAGAEKLRYITGYAVAFNKQAETVHLSLDDIYEAALNKFGIAPTRAEY